MRRSSQLPEETGIRRGYGPPAEIATSKDRIIPRLNVSTAIIITRRLWTEPIQAGGDMCTKVRRVIDVTHAVNRGEDDEPLDNSCLLYTSDAADDLLCVDLGGRR